MLTKHLRKTRFCIDGINENKEYEGYTFGEHWNGWACPRFTKEVSMEIMNDFNTKEYPAWYDESIDSFIFQMEDGDYQFDYNDPDKYEYFCEFEGVDIEEMHLYPIGAWNWIWDDTSEED